MRQDTPSSARRRAVLIGAGMATTFLVFRLYLWSSPDADLFVGPYNVHHLFTGLLLITACGLPLTLSHRRHRLLDAAAVGLGAGLGMALDEWVYLIVTDGSNASYLLPVSFWGGLLLLSGAGVYLAVLARRLGREEAEQHRGDGGAQERPESRSHAQRANDGQGGSAATSDAAIN